MGLSPRPCRAPTPYSYVPGRCSGRNWPVPWSRNADVSSACLLCVSYKCEWVTLCAARALLSRGWSLRQVGPGSARTPRCPRRERDPGPHTAKPRPPVSSPWPPCPPQFGAQSREGPTGFQCNIPAEGTKVSASMGNLEQAGRGQEVLTPESFGWAPLVQGHGGFMGKL